MTIGFTRSGVAIVAVGMAFVMAGCSSTSTTSSSAAGTSSAAGSSSASGCGGGAVAGQGGILQVFCGGTGDAKITMGSASKELTEGTCVVQDGQFAINFGAVAGPDFPSGQAKPDYLGALVDQSNGSLGAFTFSIDGVSSGVISDRTATVSSDKKYATLNGKRLSDGASVTVDVTC